MSGARWTREQEDRLRYLIEERKMTQSQAARELGVSRNSVTGKVHRLGIELSVANRMKLTPNDRQKRVRHTVKDTMVVPRGGVLFTDLSPRACQYELGAPFDRPRKFCGKPKSRKGSHYCDKHRAVCYVTSRSKRSSQE